MSSIVSMSDIESGLRKLGVRKGMAVEVHSSLHSFGYVDGGAETLINALMQVVGSDGAIVMPSFKLSTRMPINNVDRELGLTCKIKILQGAEGRSGMGIIADTFRTMQGVRTGQGVFRVSAWGKDADRHSLGFQHLIDINGWALLLGVDIYSLSTMHYVESYLPEKATNIFKPSEKARMQYPEDEWFIESGEPPVTAWYTIQNQAYEKGMIKEGMIGDCKCMLFKVQDVIGLYRQALQSDPFGLYGLSQKTEQ
ncbi:AAC(3) family N-acetyltransferase [Paenibacillus sp. BAC0078]